MSKPRTACRIPPHQPAGLESERVSPPLRRFPKGTPVFHHGSYGSASGGKGCGPPDPGLPWHDGFKPRKLCRQGRFLKHREPRFAFLRPLSCPRTDRKESQGEEHLCCRSRISPSPSRPLPEPLSILTGVDHSPSRPEKPGDLRPVRLGQEHTPLHHPASLHSDVRNRRISDQEPLALEPHRAGGVPRPPHRVRVPGPPPAAAVHGPRRRPAAGTGEGGRGVGSEEEKRARTLTSNASGSAHGSSIDRRMISGGKRQRVAVCRAAPQQAATPPRGRKPTGSLDQETAAAVGTLLLKSPCEEQAILVCVTHSRELADRFLGTIVSVGESLKRPRVVISLPWSVEAARMA